MKISTYHKANGDKVYLNGVGKFDKTYGSWLFDFSPKGVCDEEGGPGLDPSIRLNGPSACKPDYDLMGLDYSLGYTWSYCPRKCGFCKVPKQNNPRTHQSIWDFHDSKFKKICLLNNNTLSDPQWRKTFAEIWEADLTVIDENGYDLRLLDDDKAKTLSRTRWYRGKLGFAWDLMKDESSVLNGLEIAKEYGLLTHNTNIYILIGYNTTEDEDVYRCQKAIDFGANPFPMPYKQRRRRFKRFINLHYYRSYPTVKAAWMDYKRNA